MKMEDVELTREMIEALEAEIAVQKEKLDRLKAEYATLHLKYPSIPPSRRYEHIVEISELTKEIRSKRSRLGWLRK